MTDNPVAIPDEQIEADNFVDKIFCDIRKGIFRDEPYTTQGLPPIEVQLDEAGDVYILANCRGEVIPQVMTAGAWILSQLEAMCKAKGLPVKAELALHARSAQLCGSYENVGEMVSAIFPYAHDQS